MISKEFKTETADVFVAIVVLLTFSERDIGEGAGAGAAGNTVDDGDADSKFDDGDADINVNVNANASELLLMLEGNWSYVDAARALLPCELFTALKLTLCLTKLFEAISFFALKPKRLEIKPNALPCVC